jgi:L-alanine-DL-glutamate epimerase-like enolase superfamily enzyme
MGAGLQTSGVDKETIERVKEIRKAVGNSIHITVDANQSYLPKTAIDTLKRMQEYGVELCEQPVRADDWQGLAVVTRAVDCLIEAHESARTLEDIFGLVLLLTVIPETIVIFGLVVALLLIFA